MGHSASLPTHVAMKYGRSNMASNGKSGVFLNFNHKLWVIYRSCRNSVTAVKLYMQGCLLGHTTYLGSHVAMKNGRSNMAHLTAGLYISNVRRSTISRNNNTTYFEPSIFVYVHVHFVITLTNVWQLFTLRSNLSSKSLFSTYFGFVNCHSDINTPG